MQTREKMNTSNLSRICRVMSKQSTKNNSQEASNSVPRSSHLYNVNYGISLIESKVREYPRLAKLSRMDVVQSMPTVPRKQDTLGIQTAQINVSLLRLSRRDPLSPLRKPWGFGGGTTPSMATTSPNFRHASGLSTQTASSCDKTGTKSRTGSGEFVAFGRSSGIRGRRKSDLRAASRQVSSSIILVRAKRARRIHRGSMRV